MPEAQVLPKQLRDQMAQVEQMRAGNENEPTVAAPTTAPAPVPTTAPAPAPTPAPAPAPQDEATLQQRYSSLQGRFEQERRDKEALGERLNGLELVVARLQAGGAQPAPEPQTPAERARLISEQEAADYGEEMLDVVGRRAKEVYAPEFEQMAARLARAEARLEGVSTVVERTDKQKMYDGLTAAVPDWQTINFDEGFKAWLAQPDPMSGMQRHKLLTEAFTRHETDRVVRFFQGYAEATGTPTTAQVLDPSAPPLAQPGNGSGKPTLMDFAAPGRARSGPDVVTPEKPIYTNASVTKFYADKLRGKWAGREADAAAIEQDIFLAQHEGRIVP